MAQQYKFTIPAGEAKVGKIYRTRDNISVRVLSKERDYVVLKSVRRGNEIRVDLDYLLYPPCKFCAFGGV